MTEQTIYLQTSPDGRELVQHGTPLFPCAGYCEDVRNYANAEVPWHWHEELELILVRNGVMHVILDGMDMLLEEGECALINSNILHMGERVEEKACQVSSLVFHPSLIYGEAGSILEHKYVRPLLNCRRLPGIGLQGEAPWKRQAAGYIRQACDAYETAAFGYELAVRDSLSRMWMLIVEHMQPILEQERGIDQQTQRIKAMLSYIQTHCGEALTLKQIADAANISSRECLRCFQRVLGMSPMQYLLKYRVSAAADLLTAGDLSITEIAKQCGFDSPSYFAKIFKRFMQCTPSAYRGCEKRWNGV